MYQRFVVVIGGPTGSGKTSLAVEIATLLGTEIISADSRQIFKELNIGVARPSASDLSRVKHHFIAEISIQDYYSAGTFGSDARERLHMVLHKYGCAVIAGGTGLYIQALLNGLDAPEVDLKIRAEVQQLYDNAGIEALHLKLQELGVKLGPLADKENPARMKRLLEKMLYQIRTAASPKSREDFPAQIFGYYLNPSREDLYRNINHRVDTMIQNGLEQEVRSLIQFRHENALRSVGYTEFFNFFDGTIPFDACKNLIAQHTRNYAKRQITWFKNKTNFQALLPNEAKDIILADLTAHGYSIHK